MACTRPPGMARPSSTRSGSSGCGPGINATQGSPPARSPGALCTVKSAGATRSRSSHGTGNEHRHPGADPGAVRRRHGGAAGPGGIEEDLSAPVLPDEGGRRQRRVDPLGAGGQGPGGERRLLGRGRRLERHEHVDALGAAGLDRTVETGVGQRLADDVRRPHRQREPAVLRRIEVDDQVGGVVRVIDAGSAWGGIRPPAGWRTTARSAGRCPGRRTPAAGTSRPTGSRSAPTRGCTRGTFFCMNGFPPRWTRITDRGRSRRTGTMRSATASR